MVCANPAWRRLFAGTTLAIALGACRASPPANPAFDDAAKFLFVSFEDDDATLAFAIRSLETQLYLSLDVEARGVLDRAVALSRLTEADVANLAHPDRPVADALPVALAGVSAHPIDEQQHIQLLSDQTPVEPYSPDEYTRTFLGGDGCWIDHGCASLLTSNYAIKTNALMSVPYTFLKTFRWVDLSLPDPADTSGMPSAPPRWAIVARSWTTETFSGENGNAAINQSFTVEVWVPRDGSGFLRDPSVPSDWTADSTGGGTLRFLAVWHETDVGLSAGDTLVEATTRGGIDDNFDAAEDWLDEAFPAR